MIYPASPPRFVFLAKKLKERERIISNGCFFFSSFFFSLSFFSVPLSPILGSTPAFATLTAHGSSNDDAEEEEENEVEENEVEENEVEVIAIKKDASPSSSPQWADAGGSRAPDNIEQLPSDHVEASPERQTLRFEASPPGSPARASSFSAPHSKAGSPAGAALRFEDLSATPKPETQGPTSKPASKSNTPVAKDSAKEPAKSPAGQLEFTVVPKKAATPQPTQTPGGSGSSSGSLKFTVLPRGILLLLSFFVSFRYPQILHHLRSFKEQGSARSRENPESRGRQP